MLREGVAKCTKRNQVQFFSVIKCAEGKIEIDASLSPFNGK